MIDYTQLAERVRILVEKHGREVTFVRFHQTPADGAKPWRGPADPRASVDAEATVKAVFVPPSSADRLGMSTVDEDLLRRTAFVCIVGPGSTAPPFDLSTAHEIMDEGGVRRRVTFVETLRPNVVTLLYFVGVQR